MPTTYNRQGDQLHDPSGPVGSSLFFAFHGCNDRARRCVPWYPSRTVSTDLPVSATTVFIPIVAATRTIFEAVPKRSSGLPFRRSLSKLCYAIKIVCLLATRRGVSVESSHLKPDKELGTRVEKKKLPQYQRQVCEKSAICRQARFKEDPTRLRNSKL